MTTLLALGKQVHAARTHARLTQSELASRAGVHRNTVLQLEKGEGNTRLGVLLAICDVLGLEPVLLDKQISQMASLDDATELTQSQQDAQALMRTGVHGRPGGVRGKAD